MDLRKLEEERLVAFQSSKKKNEIGYLFLISGLILTLLFSLIIAFSGGTRPVFTIFLVVGILLLILAVVFIFLSNSENKKYRNKVSRIVAQAVLENLYGKVELNDENSSSIDELIAFDVAHKPDRHKTVNHYFGKYQNVKFETGGLILEKETMAEVSKKTKKKYQAYFNGFFIHLMFKNLFKGTLLVKEAEFWTENKDTNLEKYETGDDDFDQRFKIYTSNRELADSILTTRFIKHLSEIADANASQTFLLIKGNNLYLVFDERNKKIKLDIKTSLNAQTLEKTIADYRKIKVLSDDLLEKGESVDKKQPDRKKNS